MLKAYKYRIYPTKDQKELIKVHFGACRFVYNRFLSIRQTMYSKFRISIKRSYLDDLLSEKKTGFHMQE